MPCVGVSGFLDNHGVHTTIDPPGSHLTEPISINAKGQIVGVYREQGEPGDGSYLGGGLRLFSCVEFNRRMSAVAKRLVL